MVSRKDLNSAEWETVRISKKSDDGVDVRETLKNWRRWTHLNSTQKQLNAKEVSMKGENFMFPIEDGTLKIYFSFFFKK